MLPSPKSDTPGGDFCILKKGWANSNSQFIMYKKSLLAKDRKGAGWVAIGQGGMPRLQGV